MKKVVEEDRLIRFYKDLIRTQSYWDEEGNIAGRILREMEKLGYDEVFIDRIGNVVGRIGDGKTILHFDSHMDTVRVNDPESWELDPFGAREKDGFVYGRGSVDMKGGLAASVYAAAMARDLGKTDGKTVYVTGSVCEEFCDGVNLEHFYKDRNLRPDYCIICEPSDDEITLGHTGKVQIRITTYGVSAHGSAPEKGVNAVYEMAPIIEGVNLLNQQLRKAGGGTVVLSDISSTSASLNAVPSECTIYLDRRLRIGESVKQVYQEMNALIEGRRAVWETGTLKRTSWTGEELVYNPAHEPWVIDQDTRLVQSSVKAYKQAFGREPDFFEFWDFSTNAVTPVSMGIPTIGFGPGEYKLAHTTNERCRPEQVEEAARFYTELIGLL